MEKIVIFSQYLRHLDVVLEALSRRYDITALRYDGTMPPSKREKVQRDFKDCHAKIPLLINTGSGGVRLNITSASIVIILEILGNSSGSDKRSYCDTAIRTGF